MFPPAARNFGRAKQRKIHDGMSAILDLSGPETSSERTLLRNVDLRGPAGRLEALLNEGAPGAPVAALVCHPHPLGGGTMHNRVVYHAAKVLNAPEWGLRWPVLRFNFRGTGLSEGQHHGLEESDDVNAAVNWLVSEYRLPVIVVGFSFGAALALLSCCNGAAASRSSSILALVALGLPSQGFGHSFRYPFLAQCTFPKLFISGDRDWFAPQPDLKGIVDAAADPKRLVLIPGADHSFTGHLEAMQHQLARWLKEQVQ